MNHTKKFILGTVLGLGLAFSSKAANPDQGAGLSNDVSRVSYALGVLTGQQWKMQGLAIDPDVYAQGIKDAMGGHKTLLTLEEAEKVISNFQQEYVSKQQQLRAEQGAKNKIAGEAFLATNKNNAGVITLPDGLQYRILTKGSGTIPAIGDFAMVHYRGTLLDGTEFDNSIKRGQPFQVRVGIDKVITGWTEALQLMPVGSKWKLFIPAQLAYGEQGRQTIPPNSVLIFEVEMLEVKPGPAVPSTPISSDIIKVQGTNAEVIKTGNSAKQPKK